MRITAILIIALLFTASSLYAERTLDLRLNPVSVDESSSAIYVDIEVRFNQSGQFNLAGQNFRLFYNAQSLHLDVAGSASKLPKRQYGELNVVDHIEGIEADEVNQIEFDDNLGFVNASIDLKANRDGGIVLERKDSWVAVARLKFNVRETLDNYEVVWGRKGKTDKYATAFVEMSEWVEPFNIKTVEVEYYEDLSISNEAERLIDTPTITVGPNPTTQFIRIGFSKPSVQHGSVVVRDVAGRMVKKQDFTAGEASIEMDLTDLAASNYFLEVRTEAFESIYHEKILITR